MLYLWENKRRGFEMRDVVYAAAAILAGCLGFCHEAGAAPLTATYTGTLLGSSTQFDAVFHYDTEDLVQDATDTSLFNGVGAFQSATLTSGNFSFTFDSSSYFYERVISGAIPNYEFGIRQTDGAFLYLKLNGATQEGNYGLSGGLDGTDLDPASVTIAPVVSPVPLPPALALFAGSLLALGFAGFAGRRKGCTPELSTSATV